MTRSIFRYVLVGATAIIAGTAWGDTIYMFSRPDGTLYFSSASTAPRFEAYLKSRGYERRRSRPVGFGDAHNVNKLQSGKTHYEPLVEQVARDYQLDSALLHAVISVESRYDHQALSPAGAAGLMQLMPATAKRYGVQNVLDPEQNLHGGARYLRDLLHMFGSDVRLALAAYHAGEYAVARNQNRIPPFQSTMDFVTRVLDLYYKYRGSPGH